MVKNLGNKIEYLDSSRKYIEQQSSPGKKFIAVYNELKNKTNIELVDICSSSRNKISRHVAVYLLRTKITVEKELLDILYDRYSYESSDIRKEILWTLSKHGYTINFPELKKMLQGDNFLEASITAKILGDNDDDNEAVLVQLLKLFMSVDDSIANFSAGLAIFRILVRKGLNEILKLLYHNEELISTGVCWILSCYINNYENNAPIRKTIIDNIQSKLKFTTSDEQQLLLAYILSTLNCIDGAKELFRLYNSNKIIEERKVFFWKEITRNYLFHFKENYLEIINELTKEIILGKNKKDSTITSLVANLKDSYQILDKILDFTNF